MQLKQIFEKVLTMIVLRNIKKVFHLQTRVNNYIKQRNEIWHLLPVFDQFFENLKLT